MFHIIRLDTYDYNPLSKIKEKYCNEKKKKNHPVNIFYVYSFKHTYINS